MNLESYGFNIEAYDDLPEGVPARVTAVHKERYELVCEQGHCYGRLKTSVYYGKGLEPFPTTGDFVLITYHADGDCQIIKTLSRTSKFVRSDFSGHNADYVKTVLEQVVAANFDYVFIMQSLNNDFNARRLERYLTLAWQSGAEPVVVLTKADLAADYTEQLHAVEGIAMGAGVFAVSARTGFGLEALAAYLKPGKTIVFLGSSGVGKSSLVNALAGEDLMTVKEIREDDSRGRHTTTHRQLIMLNSGVMIIDTPGMRELGMWDVSSGLGGAFSDVEQYLGTCRFSDCTHRTEPGCAVKMAIESGALPEERWNSYMKLKREAKFAEDKAGYNREVEEMFRKIEIAQRKQQKVNKKRG